MKIKIGKKYKTRDCRDVRIYAIDVAGDKKVHGAILDETGFYQSDWFENGSISRNGKESDFDLVECKEDWEILTDTLTFTGIPSICVLVEDSYLVSVRDFQDKGFGEIKLKIKGGIDIVVFKKDIKLATLEDCKRFILEK